MGLRDSLKQRIKQRVTSDRVAAAGQATSRAASGASRARERAAALQAELQRLDAGEAPEGGDDARTQAARAEEVATMTAPVNARLDPIDVPHPFEPERQGGGRPPARRGKDKPTMEDLILGETGTDGDGQESEMSLFESVDNDEEQEPLFGGL